MSFIGSINAETRRWLGNNGPAFDGREVWVGCSGAFTVEQILTRYAPKAKLRGNDVSIYSGVLGAYLTGQPFNLSVQEEKFAWLEPYLGDEEAKAATVMVLFEALKYEKDKNLFQHRHWAHYLNNFGSFHQGTVARLRERKKEVRLEGYTTKDIYDLLDEAPKDGVIIAFLPTYAGGYERMFRRLEEIFECRPEGELYLGIDFGYRNPFACLWVQPIERGERVLVLDEYYQRFRTTLENSKAVLAQHLASGYGPITDAFADPSDPDKRAMLSEILGVEVKAPRRLVEVGQELVRRWLKVRPGSQQYPGHVLFGGDHLPELWFRQGGDENTGVLGHELPFKGPVEQGGDSLRRRL
jgi:hypothetical protein